MIPVSSATLTVVQRVRSIIEPSYDRNSEMRESNPEVRITSYSKNSIYLSQYTGGFY